MIDMSPSHEAETAEQMNYDFGTTFDDLILLGQDNILPSLVDSSFNLIPVQSAPPAFLTDEGLNELAAGCDNIADDQQLQTCLGQPVLVSQAEGAVGASCPIGVIPLTVLELGDDDAANTSPERTSMITDDVLTTSGFRPDDSKRERGCVRRSKSSLGSSGKSKAAKARNLSVNSPVTGPSHFCATGNADATSGLSVGSQMIGLRNDDPCSWLLELRCERNAVMDRNHCWQKPDDRTPPTNPSTEDLSSAEVPREFKRERRRAQNRVAANRCRIKRKRQEDQLQKDFDLATKDNRLRRLEIQTLASTIQHLKTELHRHQSTEHCLLQLGL